MINPFKPFNLGIIAGFVGTVALGLTSTTQAQESVSQEQKNALEIATQLTTQQQPYYQKNGEFNTDVKKLAKELDITLPSSFNYGIRTGFESAYIYVMPAKTDLAEQLKSYIGAAFINPNNKSEMISILCENTKLGRMRPADPKLLMSGDQPTLECGEGSAAVPISEAKK